MKDSAEQHNEKVYPGSIASHNEARAFRISCEVLVSGARFPPKDASAFLGGNPAPRKEEVMDIASERLVAAVCDRFLEWLELQDYNSMEAAEIVADCRALAEGDMNQV